MIFFLTNGVIMKRLLFFISFILPAICLSYGTPDEETPSMESICDTLPAGDPGHGYCIAYCEAMDCDSNSPNSSITACEKVKENFKKKTGKDKVPCEAETCPCKDLNPTTWNLTYQTATCFRITTTVDGMNTRYDLNNFPNFDLYRNYVVTALPGASRPSICFHVVNEDYVNGGVIPISPAQADACAKDILENSPVPPSYAPYDGCY